MPCPFQRVGRLRPVRKSKVLFRVCGSAVRVSTKGRLCGSENDFTIAHPKPFGNGRREGRGGGRHVAQFNGLELDRVIVVLNEMVRLARDGRCIYCDWPLAEDDKTGCTKKQCSYIPSEHTEIGRHESAKMKERRAAMGFDV